MNIRPAETLEDRDAIARLTYDIYVEEMGWDDIGDPARRMVTFPDDQGARFFLGHEDGQVAGAIRLQLGADGPFDEETRRTYDLGRFAGVADPAAMAVFTRLMTRAQYRSGFLSFALMHAAGEVALRRGIELFFCDCQPHLVDLYTRAGFHPYTRCFSHPVAGLMVPLVGAPLDLEVQRERGSPFLALCERYHRPSQIPGQLAEFLVTAHGIERVSNQEEAARWVREYEAATSASEDRARLLDGLPAEAIAGILARGSVLECRDGDRIIRKGAGDQTFYVILDGTVEIRVGDRPTDQATRGDLIGEMAYLLRAPRTANVYAVGDVRVLSLRRKAIEKLRDQAPDLAARLFENLARILGQKLVSLHRRHLV